MSKKWYCVHAQSGRETQSVKILRDHIQRANMGDFFGEILIPVENVVEMKDGKKRAISRKAYPGYIFMEMDLNHDRGDDIIIMIRKIVKGADPKLISNKEVETIKEQMVSSVAKPKSKVNFDQGEVVHIIDGAFKDFDGQVEEVDIDRARLKVSVLIFGRATPVELSYLQVEKSK